MRDITLSDTFYMLFTTRAFATGVPTTLAGTPVVSAYENDSVTQITAGITLGVDHDSVTGLNLLTIVATGANGYESGKDYALVVTTGTVGGVSVVGEVVGEFSIGRSAAAVDLANGTDGLGAIKAETALIVADTNELQTDDVPGLIATAQADLDVLTGTDGATLATAQANYAPAKAGDSMALTAAAVDAVLDETLTAHVTADSLAVAIKDTLADTNELQSDDTPTTLNAIVTDLDDIKGTGFVKDTHSLVDIETFVDILDDGTSGNAKIATDVAAVLVDTGTTIPGTITTLQADTDDIQTRIPEALVSGKIDANVGSISGTTASADNLEASMVTGAIITGAAVTGTLSTTQATSDLTGYTDDQLIGRIIIWTSGNAQGEATDITDYANASGLLTFTALTTAPANTDTFVVV